MAKKDGKHVKGLQGEQEWRHVLVYAPPGWALFELRVIGDDWKMNEFASGTFNFGDDLAADMQAMDEFVVLCLRYPNARVYFEDELGNERRRAWLEYAMHRLDDEPRGLTLTREERDEQYSDAKLERWKYWDVDESARDAIRLGIKAISEWKAE